MAGFLLTFSAGSEIYHLDCYPEIPLPREAGWHTLYGGTSRPMGHRSGNASNRRIKVLQHAIEARLITVADLALVDAEAAAD